MHGWCLPCVELELGRKEGAVEVDLCLEGEGVRAHPLRLHLRSSQQHKPGAHQRDGESSKRLDQRAEDVKTSGMQSVRRSDSEIQASEEDRSTYLKHVFDYLLLCSAKDKTNTSEPTIVVIHRVQHLVCRCSSHLVQLFDRASTHEDGLDALGRLRVDGLADQESPVHLKD